MQSLSRRFKRRILNWMPFTTHELRDRHSWSVIWLTDFDLFSRDEASLMQFTDNETDPQPQYQRKTRS